MSKKSGYSMSNALGKIESRIYLLRNKRVMLDRDLSALYGVKTQVLNQAVKRNLHRFPEDFMFQLKLEEYEILKSHFVTSSWGGARRALPYAFTEEGVAMLSGVLNSKMAIQVHIQIIRTFTRTRESVATYKDLWSKINEIEKKYDQQFQVVFKAIKMLLDDKPKQGPPQRF